MRRSTRRGAARNKNKTDNNKDFDWLKNLRFYFDPKQPDVLKQLSIHMANAEFQYGFEYLGVQEKLVQTPLNDRYLWIHDISSILYKYIFLFPD